MSVRKIKCQSCGLHLGEIRDAKLRKDIVHLCEDCERKRRAAHVYVQQLRAEADEKKSITDMFSDWLK